MMYNSDLPSRADLPSTRQLLRSTFIAAGVAIVILVVAVLPGEYGVDPTGAGRVLGLTQMGEIKQQLAAEAEAETAATTVMAEASSDPSADPAAPTATVGPAASADATEALRSGSWRDEVTLALAPGEAAEIKLVMKAGESASYAWSTARGSLNSDLHGDGARGESTSYRKGRAEAEDAGELVAQFDGSHGWFWRNRSNSTVDLVLQVRGEYAELKRVI